MSAHYCLGCCRLFLVYRARWPMSTHSCLVVVDCSWYTERGGRCEECCRSCARSVLSAETGHRHAAPTSADAGTPSF